MTAEDNGDLAEEIFKEMDAEKEIKQNKPVEVVKMVEEGKVDYSFNPEGKGRKEIVKVMRACGEEKKNLSAQIKSLIQERAKVTEFNIKLRQELIKISKPREKVTA